MNNQVVGIVTDCENLNIRAYPDLDSPVLCTARCGSELLIDLGSSTTRWYSVCTSMGVDGYCVKSFVEIK